AGEAGGLVPGPVLDQGEGDGLGGGPDASVGEQGVEAGVVGQGGAPPAEPRGGGRCGLPGWGGVHGRAPPSPRRAAAWDAGAEPARAARSKSTGRAFSGGVGGTNRRGGSTASL